MTSGLNVSHVCDQFSKLIPSGTITHYLIIVM